MRTIILAAMIYSAINAGAALLLLVAKVEINQIIGPTITGLIGGLPFMIVALILLVRSNSAKIPQSAQSLNQEKLPSQEG